MADLLLNFSVPTQEAIRPAAPQRTKQGGGWKQRVKEKRRAKHETKKGLKRNVGTVGAAVEPDDDAFAAGRVDKGKARAVEEEFVDKVPVKGPR